MRGMPEVRNIRTLFREVEEIRREIQSISKFYGDALDSLFIRLDSLELEIASLKNQGTGTEGDPDEGFTPMED